ncbi:transposase, partial [Pseudoalteromonas sp. BSi20311]|uniref:IS66 family transposase n=4 Tax=Pseudoalteromonas TaxID=53246 RepID=UPI00056D8B51
MKNELALKQRIAELEKLLAQKDAQIAALEERWRLAQQKQFGKSAEGFVGQGELFNEVEEIIEAAEAEQQSISYTRKKPVRKPLPKDLPREQVIHDIEDKLC